MVDPGLWKIAMANQNMKMSNMKAIKMLKPIKKL
jgi:hypothetical protein